MAERATRSWLDVVLEMSTAFIVLMTLLNYNELERMFVAHHATIGHFVFGAVLAAQFGALMHYFLRAQQEETGRTTGRLVVLVYAFALLITAIWQTAQGVLVLTA
ncbi:MAG TPA: hypothetical protein VEB18_04150 [Candidatus Paceibacterota bacterium]|nr:hypothetical protein [Candidatus Paceibacterota bacterium]